MHPHLGPKDIPQIAFNTSGGTLLLASTRNLPLIDTQLEPHWAKGYSADCRDTQLEIDFENLCRMSGTVKHAIDITFGSITYFLFILADNYHSVPSK